MDLNKLFKLLSFKDENDIDELSMILSNKIDMGSSDGGLISVKQFESLSSDILKWHEAKIKESLSKTINQVIKNED